MMILSSRAVRCIKNPPFMFTRKKLFFDSYLSVNKCYLYYITVVSHFKLIRIYFF